MSRKSKKVEGVGVEIVVSTYWPTRIIKSVNIKDQTSDSSFHSDIELTREQADYLYSQLKILFEKERSE